jgi:hypothetical protein
LRPEEVARVFEQLFFRGLSVVISLDGPSDSGLFNDLCPVQRHTTKV